MTTRTDIIVLLVVFLCFLPGVAGAVYLAVSLVREAARDRRARREFQARHYDWSAGREAL